MSSLEPLSHGRHQKARVITACIHNTHLRLLWSLLLAKTQVPRSHVSSKKTKRYAIIHVWKVIKGLAPNDINIESYEHIRLGVRCRVPPLPRRAPAYAKSIYDSSFAVTGPKLWNTLPRSVTCAPSLESFKSRLTSHIMGSYPDQPPIPGYTSSNSNLLLDWSTGGLHCRPSTTDGLAWISGKHLQEVTSCMQDNFARATRGARR